MCDDFTAEAEQRELKARGLSRREFAAATAATAIVGCASGASSQASAQASYPGLTETIVTIPTADGKADAFFVHPASGRHPGIVLWPDIGGLRDAFKTMGRRLAHDGYAVLVVNQYYRNSPAPVLNSFAEWRTPEGQTKLKPMIAAINPPATTRDAAAFVGFLDRQPAVDTRRKIGTNGYCMGGPYTVRTAAAVPDRVGAAASLHGANLVGPDPDSPAHLLARTKASYLFAIGRNDDARAPGDKDALRAAAAAAGRPAEIEVYPADHGWCVIDTPMYDKAAAEKAWSRMLALFAKL
ncbi:MAG: dienelactone hydrolase family protein [Novosphingobium sp.]|nr:dienelactone hydrolase family protein [Novosphingobium sp.]